MKLKVLFLIFFVDDIVCNDPIFNSEDKYYLTRDEALDRAMEKSIHYIQVCREKNLDKLEKSLLKQ